MKFHKISFSSVKTSIVKAAKNGPKHVVDGYKAAGTLAVDTIKLAKKSPKEAAVVAGVAVAGTAALAGLVSLIKSGVQKISDRKYN